MLNNKQLMFLCDRPWTSPWIKSISDELDIINHVITSQLSHYCDAISNRLWCHQQNEDWGRETSGHCVKIVIFMVIYGFLMSCEKWNNVCTLMTNCYCAHLSVIFVLISLLLRNSGNKHKSNPLMSIETVRHPSTYIILYLFMMFLEVLPGNTQF